MDPDTLTLFREVAQRSPSEREEYYAQHQTAERLRAEVESLMQAGDGTVDSFAGHLASAAVRAVLAEPIVPEPAPPRTLLQPTAIGRYEVKRLLGRGGMADVYLARDPMLERDIAVKLIGGELDSEVASRRLVREASAAGRLRHPNIVTIFDAGVYDGRPYIAMEYVPGETLRSLIRQRAPLPLRRRLELIEGACAGLAHAHHSGVVHLDIKPDNLIVDETGVVKVLDFGIARVLSSEALATRHIVGTLRYMSPEQIAGDPLDHRSDIFSLGCSLYELIAYLPAYAGSTREIVYRIAVGPVPRLVDVAPATDPQLDAAVSRAMALEPGDRFADLDEFRTELARLRAVLDPAGDLPVQMPDPRLVEQSHTFAITSTAVKAAQSSRREEAVAQPRWRTTPTIAAAVAVILLVSGALWFWGWRSAPTSEPQVATVPAQSAPAAVSSPLPEPERRDEAPAVAGATDVNEVWLRVVQDDHDGVLRLLRAAVAGGNAPRLPYDVLSAERANVVRSRQTAAAAPGATSSASYRLAEERFGNVDRLERAGDPVQALIVLWQAEELYARSVNDGRASAPSLAATPESRAPLEAAATPPPPQPSPGPAAQPPPESIVRTPPSAPAPATVLERSPKDEPARTPQDVDRDGVLEALERYRSAFQALDVKQLTQVYPALSGQVEALRKSFDGTAEYALDIREPRVQVKGDEATVDAVVVRRITPRVGQGRASSFEQNTQFRLRRAGSSWVIVNMTTPTR